MIVQGATGDILKEIYMLGEGNKRVSFYYCNQFSDFIKGEQILNYLNNIRFSKPFSCMELAN
jgi:hypothetical protein